MAEQVYYDRGSVRITSARAVFGGKTFPLANVSSVEGRNHDPARSGAYGLVLLGVIILAIGFALGSSVGFLLAFVGIVATLLGIIQATLIRPTYSVVLCSAGSERKALTSSGKNEIYRIVEALNQAIIDRG